MRKSNLYYNKKRTFVAPLFLFASTVIATIVLFTYIYSAISPMIFEAAKKRSRSFATFVISKTMSDSLDSRKDIYNQIVSFEKNNVGDITALTTNMVYMNKLKSELCTEIYNNIYQLREEDLSFPLGSAFGNLFLYGIGPMIKVRISTISSIDADFEHEFITGGINQTNHRIYMRIHAAYSLLVPFSVITEKVDTSFCVAENVIVGNIPEAFTNVQNYGANENENVADEVVDFGAHVNLD